MGIDLFTLVSVFFFGDCTFILTVQSPGLIPPIPSNQRKRLHSLHHILLIANHLDISDIPQIDLRRMLAGQILRAVLSPDTLCISQVR